MTVLVKDFLVADPGSPGTPGIPATPDVYIPGSPATAPKPAYCIDIPHPGGVLTWIYVYDPVGNPATGRPPGYVAIPGATPPSVEHVCYEAVPGSPGTPGSSIPGQPGVPGIPPVPPKPADYQVGWNAGARSIASLDANGQYSFQVTPDSSGVVTGLNDANNGSAYAEIDFAFYLASGKYEVMENGNMVGVSGHFSRTDVFIVARIGTTVQYFINGTQLYISKKPSSGPVFADASLYFGGDEIFNAALNTTVTPAVANSGGSFSGVMDGMVSFFADNDGAYLQGTAMQSMTGDFRENVSRTGQLNAVLPAMAGQFVDSKASAQSGVMGDMSGRFEADDLLQPDFNATDNTLQAISGFFIALAGLTASLDLKLPSMSGYFGDSAAATVPPGTLPTPSDPVNPYTGDWAGRSGSQLPMMVGVLLDAAKTNSDLGVTMGGDVILPSPIRVDGNIIATGSLVGNVVLPKPITIEARFGWNFEVTMPAMQADVGITIMNVVRAAITFPMPWVYGEGTVGSIFGTPDGYPLVLPRLGASGKIFTEGDGQVVLPAPLLVAGRITTDLMLGVQIRFPALRGAGLILTPDSIDPQNPLGRTLQGHVVLPPLRMDSNALWADLWLPKLRAGGHVASSVSGVPVETRIAYAMNIRTGAVTEFSNFPFRAMGRAYDSYWGIGLDGNLYHFEGDLDDLLPIDWEWRSGLNDFAVWGKKGMLAAYIRGVFENGATVTMQTDDSAIRVYDHLAAGDYKNQQVHRVPLGRGVRTDAVAFGMANPKGGYLELDKVTPEYVIVSRNL